MTTIRYLGTEFQSEATGRLSRDETTDVDADLARHLADEHAFEILASAGGADADADTDGDTDAASLESLDGVGEKLAARMRDHGFATLSDVADATVEELAVVDGISPEVAADLHRQLK